MDKRITHGMTRPKFGSKRWWDYYKIASSAFYKCEKCGAILLNPMSVVNHIGSVCDKKTYGNTRLKWRIKNYKTHYKYKYNDGGEENIISYTEK